MRRPGIPLALVSAALCGAGVLAGCSGAGTTTAPGDLAALQAAANDQVTAVLYVQRWFAILYPPRSGSARWYDLPPEPGDPPGTLRSRGVMSDGTVIRAVQYPDDSGRQVISFGDGRQTSLSWTPPRWEGAWTKRSFRLRASDGTRMEYEKGLNLDSPISEEYESGEATITSGHTMQFYHHRDATRYDLRLTPDDGSRLTVSVPLSAKTGRPFWPTFVGPATGTFVDTEGRSLGLKLWGSADGGWQQWQAAMPGGITGRFTLGDGLSGSGQLTRDGQVLAALRWTPKADGTLEPVGSGATDAVPNAAARAFAFDAWIGNIAALGPMPSW